MVMGLHDDATLNVTTGDVWIHAVGTAFPGDISNPAGSGWTRIGHTSVDEVLSVSSEGGETTVLSTLQSKSLRTKKSPKTTTYSITVMQWDLYTLQLYYGTQDPVEASGIAAGLLGVPDDPTPLQKAVIIVVWDGDTPFAWYAPKADVIGGDDPSLTDTTSLSGLQINITPLNYNGSVKKVYVLPIVTDALAIPDATAASPTSGAAGTVITITGTGFYGVTDVKFGANSAGMFTVVSPVQIKATVPTAGSAGAANITVINAAGTDGSAVTFTKS